MKKFTLVLLALTMGFASLMAEGFSGLSKVKGSPTKVEESSEIITEVEGEVLNYVTTGRYSMYPDDLTYLIDGYGLSMRLVFDEDGETVYMQNVIPAYQGSAWLKGTMTNSIISVPTGQVVDDDNGFGAQVLIGCASMDNATQQLVLVQDALFKVSEDRTRIEHFSPTPEPLYMLAYDSDGRVGQIIGNLAFDRIGNAPEPPADAEVTDYMMYRAADWDKNMGRLAISGDDVYLQGVPYHMTESWMKGSKSGNDIVVPTRQYIGNSGNYVTSVYAKKNGGSLDEFTLIMDEDMKSYTLEDGVTVYFGTREYDEDVTMGEFHMEPFHFDLVKPAAPEELQYDADTNILMFKIFLNSVNDNELERELVYYRIYLDGKLLTFTKDKYPFLEEDMTDIPYAKMYYDSENRSFWGGGSPYMPTALYLRETGFKKVGVQEVYRYKDQETASDITELKLGEDVNITKLVLPSTIYPGNEIIGKVYFVNESDYNINEIEFAFELEGLEPQIVKAEFPYFPLEPWGYDRTQKLTFACGYDENKAASYKFYVASINGEAVESPKAITGTMKCIKDGFEQNLVYEAALSTASGFCPIGEYGMDYMTENYGDKGFIGISVHLDDEMSVTADDEAYGPISNKFWSTPTSYLNRGMTSVYPNPDLLTESYEANIGLGSAANITAEIIYESDDKTEISVNTKSKFLFDEENANYSVGYVVVENNVGPYVQQNAYTGASYDCYGFEYMEREISMSFNNVARNCSEPVPFESAIEGAVVKNTEYEYPIDIDLFDVENHSNYKVVVLLIDNTSGEIVNACYAESKPNGTDTISAADESFKVRTGRNTIAVSGDARVDIYSLSGLKVAGDVSNGAVKVEKGAYIVTDGVRSEKVMVK